MEIKLDGWRKTAGGYAGHILRNDQQIKMVNVTKTQYGASVELRAADGIFLVVSRLTKSEYEELVQYAELEQYTKTYPLIS